MKKVVSLILTLVFVVGMCSTAAFATGGDVNNDNTVNSADLLALEQHILGVNVIDCLKAFKSFSLASTFDKAVTSSAMIVSL